MSHHAFDPEQDRDMKEAFKKIIGEFPDGRLNAADEGAISVAISHQNGRVVMRFPKNVTWIGFTADEAVGIAEILIEHARSCGSKKPLSVKIG